MRLARTLNSVDMKTQKKTGQKGSWGSLLRDVSDTQVNIGLRWMNSKN